MNIWNNIILMFLLPNYHLNTWGTRSLAKLTRLKQTRDPLSHVKKCDPTKCNILPAALPSILHQDIECPPHLQKRLLLQSTHPVPLSLPTAASPPLKPHVTNPSRLTSPPLRWLDPTTCASSAWWTDRQSWMIEWKVSWCCCSCYAGTIREDAAHKLSWMGAAGRAARNRPAGVGKVLEKCEIPELPRETMSSLIQ